MPGVRGPVVDPSLSLPVGGPDEETVVKAPAYRHGPAPVDVPVGRLDGRGPVGVGPG